MNLASRQKGLFSFSSVVSNAQEIWLGQFMFMDEHQVFQHENISSSLALFEVTVRTCFSHSSASLAFPLLIVTAVQ